MTLSADVDGLDRLTRSVDAAADDLVDLDQVNADAAAQVVRAVEAPRVTGTLADTVTATVDRDGWTVTAGGKRAPYVAIVHARNPFLTRAMQAREEAVIDAYRDHVTDTVNTIQGA